MSYSQNDEELHILAAVGDGPPGILLDIGAFDGRMFSNSLALIERGWSAVLVEPSISAFGALLALHGTNPRVQLVHALVGLAPQLSRFWDSPDAVSTTSTWNQSRWASAAQFRPPYYAPEIPIRDIIKTFPALTAAAFVSFDTEGTSSDLFINYPFGLGYPRCVCVEYDDAYDSVLCHAKDRGYTLVHRNSENVILVRQ
jgi:FkbM family methyltransferase